MGNKKIYELAKEINKTNKETIEIANSLGIDVKSHLNNITEEEANKIILSLEKKEKTTKAVDNIKDMEKVDKKEEPVIIRRQVVVDENKKVVKNLEEVGKISKNTQKEYNIVSRKQKKENKPMTLNELLGLGKKKEKQDIKIKEGKEIDMNKEDMQNKSNNKNYKEERNNKKGTVLDRLS